MKGRRLLDGEIDSFLNEPGVYGRHRDGTTWYAVTPNGLLANITGHSLTIHEDGTVTAAPSILCTAAHKGLSWHGYLERGVWREC